MKEKYELERLLCLDRRVDLGLLGERKEHEDQSWHQGVVCGKTGQGCMGGGEGVRIGKEDFKRFAVVDESFWNFQR